MRLGEPDASGRRRPEPISGSEYVIAADLIISAIGLSADAGAFAGTLESNRNGTLTAREGTLETQVPGIFAAGDVVNGATDITRAVGEGRRSAHMIDRWLNGLPLDGFDLRLPVVDKKAVLARQAAYEPRPATANGTALVAARATSARSRPRSPRTRPARARSAASTAPSAPAATSA